MITEAGLETHPAADLAALLTRTDGFLWVDLPAGDASTAHILTDVFGFHALAVKDSLERNRVPRTKRSKGFPPGPRSSSPRHWSPPCTG
jgi:magnesium transporter